MSIEGGKSDSFIVFGPKNRPSPAVHSASCISHALGVVKDATAMGEICHSIQQPWLAHVSSMHSACRAHAEPMLAPCMAHAGRMRMPWAGHTHALHRLYRPHGP